MSDLLKTKETALFFEATLQPKRDVEQVYSINRQRIEQVLDLLSCLLEGSALSFCGMSILPNGLDATITLRVGYLSKLDEYDMSDLYEIIKSYKVTPLEDHFLIEMVIDDFYVIDNDTSLI